MKVRLPILLTAAAMIGGASLLAVSADAQQNGPGDRPADSRPGPRGGPGGPGGPGPRGPRPQMSLEDRAAFFDARLAAIRAGLRLSADQDKMWPPIEAAARDMQKTMADMRRKAQDAGRPANPIDGLKRRGEADTARGAALTRLADAAQPLWATLSDEQKRRFPMLARGMMGGGRDGRPQRAGPNGRPPGPGPGQEGMPMRRGDNQGPPPGGPQGRGPGPGGPQRQGDIGQPGGSRLGLMGPVDRVYP